MKKKFLALFICLTLCLPLLLASCELPDLLPQQGQENKITFFDEISCMWDKKESYDSSSAFVAEGGAIASNDKFTYRVAIEYSNKEAGTISDKTVYRVYDIASGKLLFEDFVSIDIATLSYTSDSKAIDVMLLDKMFFVTKTSTQTSKETGYFYDDNGNELLKTDTTAFNVIDEDRIIVGDKLYVLKNGMLEMKKDLSSASPVLYSMIGDLRYFGDRYTYLDEGVVYVFDEDYNFLYKKVLKQTQGATFADERYSYHTLANGNIIFQTTYSVGAYSASLQPYTYDFVSGGKCYKLDSYLLDIRSGSYKEIELSYILTTVLSADTQDGVISLPYGAQNISVGQKIDGKKLISEGGASYTYFLLYNNGSTKGFPSVDGSAELTVIGKNRFIVEDGFSVKVYNENATLIGTLGSYKHYNEKFIVTDSAILNHDLETVYSLTENNAAVSNLTADSAFVVAYDKETKLSTTYLITGSGEPKKVSSENDIVICDGFYATTEIKNGAAKLIIHKTDGEIIDEYAIKDGAGIGYYNYDGYSILETESIEGKTMYVTVFKAE